MIRRPIYNFEFPLRCSEVSLFEYRFVRVQNYEQQLQRLQNLNNVHKEFNITANTGEHAITAYVNLPEKEHGAALEWAGNGNTALMDVLLLLSLFTGRDVFAGEPGDENSHTMNTGVLNRDSRVYRFGGSLSASISYKPKTIGEGVVQNVGFEEELNRIYLLIRSKEWQEKYRGGYFLFLARQAFHCQTLEASFIQSWTIWEHLFAIFNQSWLSKRQIHDLSSAEKISFLLVEYALRDEIDDTSRSRIAGLAEIRNRLIHFGRFPDRDKVHDDAVLFIRLTEFILTKILGLSPSNVFDTMEKLEKYLRERNKA